MKSTRIAIAVLITLAAVMPFAGAHDGKHPDAPNPSPNATVSQEVGFENVSLRFGRPGVKGRTIWGELVPYGELWMGGANGSTAITFEEDVTINGNPLPAGSYGLHSVPSATEWTFIFSKDSSRFGIMKYSPDNDALRITATPEEAPHQEWLTYEFEKQSELSASLSLRWESLRVGFVIEAPDHRKDAADK